MARLAVGRYGEESGQRSDMIVSTMYIFLIEIVKSLRWLGTGLHCILVEDVQHWPRGY